MRDENGYRLARRPVMQALRKFDIATVRQEDIAKACAMSPSTMRRLLKREGTSYQELLDTRRLEILADMVYDERAVSGKRYAAQLGFKKQNSFFRWFSRVMGVCWRDWKRQHNRKLEAE